MGDEQKEAEAAEVQKALDQRDEEPTPEQENVASTDTVEVYRDTEAEAAADAEGGEVWKWRRVGEDGEIVEESAETFAGDNYALADAANKNPGVMAHVPDTPPIKEVEVEEGDEGTNV